MPARAAAGARCCRLPTRQPAVSLDSGARRTAPGPHGRRYNRPCAAVACRQRGAAVRSDPVMTTLVVVRKEQRSRHRRRLADHVRRYPAVGAVRPRLRQDRPSSRHLHRLVRQRRAPARVREPAGQARRPRLFDARRAIFETFRKLHPILKEQHFLNPKEEEDDPYESTQITRADRQRERHLRRLLDARGVRVHALLGRRARAASSRSARCTALYGRLRTAEAVAKVGHRCAARPFDKNSALPLTISQR